MSSIKSLCGLSSTSKTLQFVKRTLSSSMSQQKKVIVRKNEVGPLQDVPSVRDFHTSPDVSKLFDGILSPFKALDTWYDLEKLKQEWDPNFDSSSFKFGAKEALCTVVDLIQQKSWNELRGLITRPLLERLQQDPDRLKKINDTEVLTEENILEVNISQVAVQEIVDRKYCDIEVTFRIVNKNKQSSIFQYVLKFHREYTEGKLPQWTITKIMILKEEINN